jgi:hypothetical protein
MRYQRARARLRADVDETSTCLCACADVQLSDVGVRGVDVGAQVQVAVSTSASHPMVLASLDQEALEAAHASGRGPGRGARREIDIDRDVDDVEKLQRELTATTHVCVLLLAGSILASSSESMYSYTSGCEGSHTAISGPRTALTILAVITFAAVAMVCALDDTGGCAQCSGGRVHW